AQGLRKLTASAMALFLAVSFLSSSWSAPQVHFQRRNWTPQAMLYLKGAQGNYWKNKSKPESTEDIYSWKLDGETYWKGNFLNRSNLKGDLIHT
uniref:Uncharacterized protein n=1 Tax=Pavo cristatus TaxID=9049 RepID=A0A8C9LFF1_PAVCR